MCTIEFLSLMLAIFVTDWGKLHHAVRENVFGVATNLTQRSKALHECVENGKLTIKTAVYDLDSGYVTEIS